MSKPLDLQHSRYPSLPEPETDVLGARFRILDLAFDLLLEITAWLDLEDLSRLSRTCKALHESLASQLFLRPAHIREHRLETFIQSLSAGGEGDSGGRFNLLRSLVVDEQVIDDYCYPWEYVQMVEEYLSDDAPILVELLGRATSLVRLELEHVRTTLTCTQLRTALANLPALREISLSCLTDEYLTVLAEVSAPLQKVQLTRRIYTPKDGNDNRNSYLLDHGSDPFQCLYHHRATVTHLALYFSFEMLCQPEELSYSVMPCIEVVVLSVTPTYKSLRGWGRFLAKMFPSAHRVMARDFPTILGLFIGKGRDTRSTSYTNGTWPWLSFLRVDAVRQLLGLDLAPCSISYLEVGSGSYFARSDDDVATAFANIRAARAGLIFTSHARTTLLSPILQAFARMASLTKLTVDLSEVVDIRTPQDVEDVVRTHFPHLEHSASITDLLIRLRPEQVELTTSKDIVPSDQSFAAHSGTVAEPPGYVLVLRALSNGFPSLRRIALIVSAFPWRDKGYWSLLDDLLYDTRELDQLGGPDAYEVRIV
ncbi:hypothetical protein FKP32DRAFT_937629 [Trametes sanguinea]|nr:hypothetical protein FKP32DRAFT_937629 [Trametes sanguinea]